MPDGWQERDAVVVALAREADRLQAEDRRRLQVYEAPAREYLDRFRRDGLAELSLAEAHERAGRLAAASLPCHPLPGDQSDAAAQ
jgi:hypothetical protein